MKKPAISPALLKQIQRLGGTVDPKAAIPSEVETHVGPRALAPALGLFAHGVRWPGRTTYCARADEYPSGLNFSSSVFNEEGDFYDGTGVMILGHDSTGFEYVAPVDGGSTPRDPAVYRVDHAGPYELDGPEPLSQFLATLIAEGATTTESSAKIKDEKLALAIFKSLGARKKVNAAALAKLDCLQVETEGIKTLAGIEQCVGLRTLDLHVYRLGDLSAIEHLTKLEELALPYGYENLDAVRPLLRLRRLRTWAGDLRPIAALTELEDLIAGDLSSFETIGTFVKLRRLNLGTCRVANLKPFANLLRLVELNIDGLTATDLSPLGGLKNLKQVQITMEAVKSFEPLASLPKLQLLYVMAKKLPSPAPLVACRSLSSLSLRGGGLTDLTFVAKMPSLEKVDFTRNRMTDLSPLAKLPRLKQVLLGGNPVDPESPKNRAALAALRKRRVAVEL